VLFNFQYTLSSFICLKEALSEILAEVKIIKTLKRN